MKKICCLMLCAVCLVGCSVDKKEPLQPTQIVNGQSIVMPPEFYVLPKSRAVSEENKKEENKVKEEKEAVEEAE